MPIHYQERDAAFIDYHPWRILESPKYFIRGPQLDPEDLGRGNYFSLVGAAETVGVHAQEPYGAILAKRLNIPCLNLGKGGAGVAFFSRPEMGEIVARVNRGRFLILTFMSGRQTGNSLIRPIDGTCQCLYQGEEMAVERAWALITDAHWHDRELLTRLVREVREGYAGEYAGFLALVRVPVILFYFSQRQPRYDINWQKKHRSSLWSQFPQFVNDDVVGEVLAAAAGRVSYAECVSHRGIPYVLRDASGRVIPIWYGEEHGFRSRQSYYPSPEMHQDAAAALEPLCRGILGAG